MSCLGTGTAVCRERDTARATRPKARLFLRSCLTVRDGLGACPDELSLPSAPTGAGVRHDPDKALSYENVPPCRASPVTAEPRAV